MVAKIERHPAGWPGSYHPVGFADTVPAGKTFGVSTLPTAPAISTATPPYCASSACRAQYGQSAESQYFSSSSVEPSASCCVPPLNPSVSA